MNILYISVSSDQKTHSAILPVLKSQFGTVTDLSFNDSTKNKPDHLAQTMKEIKKADGIVAEVSQTNFDLGRLLTITLLQHKPMLILEPKGSTQSLELGESRLVNTKNYELDNLKKLEKNFQDFAQVIEKQRLSYRFNLMLSRDINTFLMDKAQEMSISKADYIRTLIEREMS
ncbi:hypothetical protein COY14_00345 [Candidatus Roizmanbacteria bacterium CG_4_10_14_0_2_um_filter_36_9]|uniref:Ribbon-helix-helix protein CopG domain-containing protein n=1 Tax=Candidatus Roizmanbacteria bacterium CG_4_10_14_0_2_um_filter_36_9 TaxID=1974823 RepID=A0A2M7U5X1_9BACT|nr:MAG: hypothetical protein COY14_00345 [Candidatus Roizmanbacteria bacterium CG_4_10_14_0_2_um_filter_36_9]